MELTTLAIWILLIIGLVVIALFAVFGLLRKRKAFIITVMKDYRNPDRGPQTYYAIPDKPDKSIKYYNNLFSISMARKVPIYDMSAWSERKHLKVVRGVTGKPGDDMDVPIGLSLNSQAAAREYAKMVSDSVTHIVPFYDECKRLDLRVGETGIVAVKRKGEGEKLKGEIRKISANGVIFEYATGEKSKTGEPIFKQLNLDIDTIGEFKSTMTKEEKYKLTAIGYADFFTEMWAMQKFGIRRVEDANVMTIPAKQAIANFINGNNEFVKEGQGLLEKHFVKLIAIMFLIISALAVYFIINGNLQWNAGLTAQLISTHDAVCGINSTTSASALTGATTTINPVTALTSPVSVGGSGSG